MQIVKTIDHITPNYSQYIEYNSVSIPYCLPKTHKGSRNSHPVECIQRPKKVNYNKQVVDLIRIRLFHITLYYEKAVENSDTILISL